MKCSACQENKCEGKYENCHKCTGKDEKIECTCICQVPSDLKRKSASIFAGIAAIGVGVGLTVATGGLATVIGGASLLGAGSSMVFNPIQKTLSNECMSAKDLGKDVLLGGTIGAITGPIGSYAANFAKGATGLMTFGVRAASGSAAGAVSGVVTETARIAQGEKVTLNSFTKAVAIGATVGAVGGTSAHFASSASSKVSNEVAKAVTRVGTQSVSAAATDVGLQLYQTGTVDLKQTAMNTTAQFVVGATAEASSAAAQRTNAYTSKINDQFIEEDGKRRNMTPEQIKETKESMRNLNKSGDVENGKKTGDNNAHKLDDRANSKRGGQVAMDVGPKGEDGGRGAGRVIAEKVKGKWVYVDQTDNHDYKSCRETVKGRIQNPTDGIRTLKERNLIRGFEENYEGENWDDQGNLDEHENDISEELLNDTGGKKGKRFNDPANDDINRKSGFIDETASLDNKKRNDTKKTENNLIDEFDEVNLHKEKMQ